jgi:hypothetical protein
MEDRWNEIDRGKQTYSGMEGPVPVPLFPQFPHGLTLDPARPSVVGDRRLAAWAMARPLVIYLGYVITWAY